MLEERLDHIFEEMAHMSVLENSGLQSIIAVALIVVGLVDRYDHTSSSRLATGGFELSNFPNMSKHI